MDDNSSKPYFISFEEDPEYLYVYIEGERDSYTISMSFWNEIARECKMRGTRRVLVDENIKQNVSIADMYAVASEIPMLFTGIAIAFYDRQADQAEINEFGELVAQNRGVIGHFFADIEMAKAWLLAQNIR